MEEGIYIHLYRTTAYISKHFQKDAARSIHESLDQIIKEYTLFSANTLKSFQPLLIMFVTTQLIIFIIFIISENKRLIVSFLKLFLKKVAQISSAIACLIVKSFLKAQKLMRSY